jgi:predicted nucleic acid-binding protein
MAGYVIDTYAWIEYFRGSPEGEKAREYIEGGEASTPTIVVLELRKNFLRKIKEGKETPKGAEENMDYVMSNSTILDLEYASSVKAAETDLEMKQKVKNWGVADAIVLSAARELKAKVVTGDEHFRGLKEAVMIK